MSDEPPASEAVPMPSVNVLLDVALDERALRHQAVDALDQKAGVMLALDGALLGLAAATSTWWIVLPVALLASLAAWPAFRGLKMRRYKGLDIAELRSNYLTTSEPSTRLLLLDSIGAGLKDLNVEAEAKSRLVMRSFRITVGALALFAVLSSVGTLLASGTGVNHVNTDGTRELRGTDAGTDPGTARPSDRGDLHEGR